MGDETANSSRKLQVDNWLETAHVLRTGGLLRNPTQGCCLPPGWGDVWGITFCVFVVHRGSKPPGPCQCYRTLRKGHVLPFGEGRRVWLLRTTGRGPELPWGALRKTIFCYDNRRGREEVATAQMSPRSRDWMLLILEPDKGGFLIQHRPMGQQVFQKGFRLLVKMTLSADECMKE